MVRKTRSRVCEREREREKERERERGAMRARVKTSGVPEEK